MILNNPVVLIYGKKSLKDNKRIFVKEEDFQIPIGEASFLVPLNELMRIQKLFFKGKTLPELFVYDDFSLWWFLHPSIYPKIKKAINFTIKFLELVEKLEPSMVKIVDDFNMFDIIEQICYKKKIIFEYSKLNFLKFKIKTAIVRAIQKYRYKKIAEHKMRIRKNLYYKKYNSIPSLNSKIIFAVPTLYRRKFLNPKTENSENGEYIQQAIINMIDNKENVIGIDLDYTFRGNHDILVDRLESEMLWFPVELLTKSHSSHKHKECLDNYLSVISDSEFHKLFNFNGISLWKQLEDTFLRMNYSPYLPFYLDLVDSLVFLFTTNKPKAVFLPYETGPFALAFIVASNRFKIKTIGISHAVIDGNDSCYSYDRLATSEDPYGFPLPDITLLFGEFSKQSLCKHNYPIEKFVIFGNPVFFNLNKINAILERKELKKKYNIAENQKVILFTTEYLQEYYTAQGKYNYDTQIWYKLLENFAGNDKFLIILKPHPSENTTIYEKVLGKFSSTNVRIIQGDLFELLHASSVIISVFSTSMLDAICLNKPVIRVKFDNIEHTIPYDKFKVVISIDLNNLVPTIYEIMENDNLRNDLEKNRAIFLKEQYNIPEDKPELLLKKILE